MQLYFEKLKKTFPSLIIITYVCICFLIQYQSVPEGDELNFHLPQVIQFVEEPFKLGESYHSYIPMTPGHHVFIAWCINKLQFLSTDTLLLARAINAFFTCVLLLLLFYVLSSVNNKSAWTLFLPICFSHYTFFGMIWLGTDNSSLLWVVLATILLLTKPSIQKLYITSIFISCAILWRQVHFWLIIPLFLRCCEVHIKENKRFHFLFILAIPILSLMYFFILWQGMIPPEWAKKIQIPRQLGYGIMLSLLLGIFIFFATNISQFSIAKTQELHKKNQKFAWYLILIILSSLLFYEGNRKPQACIMYTMSLFGIYSTFYLCNFYQHCWRIVSQNILAIVIICAFSIIFVYFTPLYNTEKGGGVLWSIGSRLPYIHSQSCIFYLLFPFGCLCCYLWFWILEGQQRIYFYTIFFMWMLAHGMGANVYHRYYELSILIWLAITTSIMLHKENQNHSKVTLILSGVLGAGTYMRYFT